MYTRIYTYTLTCLFAILIIWLSEGGFILVDFAIEQENHVVAYKKVFNTGDDQFIHTGSIGSDNIIVSIVDPLYGFSFTNST